MKKDMLKKAAAVFLTAAMTAGLAACGAKSDDTGNAKQEGSDSSGKVVLNVWHQWSNDTNELKKKYDEAVEAYLSEHQNVEINTETLDTEAYKTKIAAEFAGDADGIDVFYYWGAGMAKKLVTADKLLPFDEYLTDETKSKVLEGSTGAFEFDGKLYSLPSFSWYMTLFL